MNFSYVLLIEIIFTLKSIVSTSCIRTEFQAFWKTEHVNKEW